MVSWVLAERPPRKNSNDVIFMTVNVDGFDNYLLPVTHSGSPKKVCRLVHKR